MRLSKWFIRETRFLPVTGAAKIVSRTIPPKAEGMVSHFLRIIPVMLIFGVCAVFSARSQVVYQVIKGVVKDNESHAALPGATVLVMGTDPAKGASADMDGRFSIADMPVGRYNLRISFIGYEPLILSEVEVTSGREVVLNIFLKESGVNMDDIIVKPKANKEQPLNSMAMVSARRLSVEEASRYAGGFDDPSRLASAFAGVAGGLTNNGIVVRGNAPRGVLWQMEGVPITNPSHFSDLTTFGAGGITALSSQVLSNSDFYTGAFPSQYGNALSGVFDIKLRNGNADKQQSVFQAGAIGFDLATEGPFKKGGSSSYLVNYRFSALALLASLLPDNAGNVMYQDLSWKCNWPTKRAGTFSWWGIASSDKSGADVETDPAKWEYRSDREDATGKTWFGASGVSHKLTFGNSGYLHSVVAVTGNGVDWKQDFLDDTEQLQPDERIKNTNTTLFLSTYMNRKISKRHSNRTGIRVRWMGFENSIKRGDLIGNLLETSGKEGSGMQYGMFTQSKLQLSPKLSAVLGVHAQHYALNDDWSVEPRASVKWQASPTVNFSLGYGKHSQQEFLPIYFIKDEQGNLLNERLKNTRAHHLVFTFDVALGEGHRLKAEPYYQYLYDIPVVDEASFALINLDSDWFIKEQLVNKGKGHNYGVDITLERFLRKGFYYLATASLFDSSYEGGDGIKRDTRYNRKYVVNLLAGKEWRVGKSKNNVLGINGRLNFLGGERISPVDEAATIAWGNVVYDSQRAFANQKPDVNYVDFTLSFRKNKRRHSSVWSLKMINVFGTKEFNGYKLNITNGAIEKDEEVTMVPNISYRIEF